MDSGIVKNISDAMDYELPSNGTMDQYCDMGLFRLIYPLLNVTAAVFIITVLTCLEKRTGNSKCLCCCCSPGIVYPVNLVDGNVDRLAFAAAFGLTASKCFEFTRVSIITPNIPSWAYSLYVMVYVLGMGFSFYPFFLCLSTKRKILGSILGLIYSGTALAYMLYELIKCPIDDLLDSLKGKILYLLPQMLCLLYTSFVYLHTFLKRVISLWKNKNETSEYTNISRRKLVQPHQLEHVKLLLRGRRAITGAGISVPDVDNILKIYTYKRDPTFRYSLKIIVTFTVALICIYQGALTWIFYTKDFVESSKQYFQLFDSRRKDILISLVDVVAASSALGLVFSGLVTLVNVSGILMSYRADMKRLYKGDYSKFLIKKEDISASFIVSRNITYSGSQIAYLLWGFLSLYAVFTSLGVILAVFLILPLSGKLSSDFLIPIKAISPGIAVAIIIFCLQTLICNQAFLQKIATNSNGKTNSVLALNNRKAYHNVSYFMFFFYIFLGLFGCLMNRIGRSVLLGIVFLGRMDRCLLPGFASFDKGYTSYISFLRFEETHQHPVLVTFCDLLLDHVHKNSEYNMINFGAEPACPPSRLKPMNNMQRMWLKAYTMVRNNLQNQRQEKENMDVLKNKKVTKGISNIVNENVAIEI
ncbi:hypothetical protein CHS0354_020974 [Potamilus streckersoni]|uniref:Uncharacterized protein n=1 Tax=Potamilus streckersoni TaxID=2493646 RepID=A0AAE0SZ36_9BIVA|nr:hypothetical protein CHS0354_020974 [Potamilus streckersoni]